MQDAFAAPCFQSPTRASELTSFEQNELQRSILDCFYQLDLEISLSFQKIGSISFSYQLQADSFHRFSFELRASTLCSFASDNQDQKETASELSAFRSQELSAYKSSALQRGSRGSLQLSFADKNFKPTFAMCSFHLDSFDLDQLELSTWCLAQNFKQDSLEKHSFETKLVPTIFVNNIFSHNSFNESFAINIFENNK